MRRPTPVKGFFCSFRDFFHFFPFFPFFPFSQAASVATLPSALVVEQFLLGASWVFSIQSFRAYGPVGVGIAMARDPLRRSGQALLTHPAPTLGDNAQALERIGMTNANRGEPALDVSPQAAPRQRFLTPASQSSPPQAPYCLVKRG